VLVLVNTVAEECDAFICYGAAWEQEAVSVPNTDPTPPLFGPHAVIGRSLSVPHFRPLGDYEAPRETGRSFSITDGRSTTFPNRRFTAPAYARLADPTQWR